MHEALVAIIVRNCRQRLADGDCPTIPAPGSELMEGAILSLAAENEAAASRLEALTAENKDAEDRVAAWKIQAKAWEDDARSRMAEIESLTSRLARVEGAAKAALRPQPDAYEAALEYPLKFWHEWVAEIRSGDLSDMPRMQFEAAMDEYAEARLAPLKSLSDPEGTP